MRNNAPLKEPQIRLFISPLRFPRRFRVKSSRRNRRAPVCVHKDTRDRKEDYMYHCFTSPDVISSRRSVLNLTRGKRSNNDAKLQSEPRVMQMVLLFRLLCPAILRDCIWGYILYISMANFVHRRINGTANYSVEIVLTPLSIVPNVGKHVITKPHIVYQRFDKIDWYQHPIIH